MKLIVNMKSFKLLSLVLLAAVLCGGLYGQEEVPVKVSFTNGSNHAVQVHVVAYDVVNSTRVLAAAGGKLELDVPYGHAVRLEYLPSPRLTELSQMGMWNELYRTISIRDDGDGIFINESFSGARKNPPKKGADRKRSDGGVAISDPSIGRVSRPGRKADDGLPEDKQSVTKSKSKWDPTGINFPGSATPAPKKKRKEDPSKPAPKLPVEKSKKKDKELKKKKEKQ